MNQFKILDCTFRDGGYYNNWNFPPEIIQKQISNCSALGIDILEIGFRFLNIKNVYGHNARSEKNFINSFDIPHSLKIALMFNASDIIQSQKNPAIFKTFIENQFYTSLDIQLIRIACHTTEFEEIVPTIEFFKSKNIKIALNLMQISKVGTSEIIHFIDFCKSANVDIIYFADSLGGLFPEKTKKIAKVFKNESDIPFGIHAHDNLGMALMNSVCSIENGATYVDASITGMGRGPGNTILEELLQLKGKMLNHYPDFGDFHKLIQDYFEPLKDKHKWGKNYLFFNAGLNDIHPTYVQEISKIKDLSFSKKLDIIKSVARNTNKHSFNKDILWNELVPSPTIKNTDTNPHSALSLKRNVLILGPHSFNSKNKYQLDKFLNINRCSVILTNPNFNESEKYKQLIDYGVVASPIRWEPKFESYFPLISPFRVSDKNIYYGLKIEDKIKIDLNQVTLPKPLVLPYIISFLSTKQRKNIVFFGFDEIATHDDREIIEDSISVIQNTFKTAFFSIHDTPDSQLKFTNPIFFYNSLPSN